MGVTKAKQVVVLECAHEACNERHLLKPGTFTIVRGREGEGAKTYKPKFYAEDREWARAVKARDMSRCRKCGIIGSDAAHIFSRRYKATRHLLLNGIFLCKRDHAWAHANLQDFEEWAKEEIGLEVYETLRVQAHGTTKRVPRRVP